MAVMDDASKTELSLGAGFRLVNSGGPAACPAFWEPPELPPQAKRLNSDSKISIFCMIVLFIILRFIIRF
jgi:hypothetical protein